MGGQSVRLYDTMRRETKSCLHLTDERKNETIQQKRIFPWKPELEVDFTRAATFWRSGGANRSSEAAARSEVRGISCGFIVVRLTWACFPACSSFRPGKCLKEDTRLYGGERRAKRELSDETRGMIHYIKQKKQNVMLEQTEQETNRKQRRGMKDKESKTRLGSRRSALVISGDL